MRIERFLCASFFFILFISFARTSAFSQTQVRDSAKIYQVRGNIFGIEAGYGWRNQIFNGLFFRLSYEVSLGKTSLNAGVFSFNHIDDGFGFDFRLRLSRLYFREPILYLSPLAGVSFIVWPQTQPTVSIGIPLGMELEIPTSLAIISVAANISPLFNLSPDVKNNFLFDLRLGIKFD